MITSNILQRTLFIRYNNSTGTAFTLDIDNHQYLLTAKHVVNGIEPHIGLEVFQHSMWEKICFKSIWVSNTGNDIALLSLKDQISPSLPLKFGDSSSFYLSQQIYFLGFPYGLRCETGKFNNGYPIPFVKTGIISSFKTNGHGNDLFFCDAINNPGFSGAPIVTTHNKEMNVIGIVSGYRSTNDPILINGQDSGLRYNSNTGLVVCYTLKEAIEEAKKKKNGARISITNTQ